MKNRKRGNASLAALLVVVTVLGFSGAVLLVAMRNNGSAINVMQAFINAVEAQSGNQIPTSDATMLTDFAANIIAVLSLAG